MFGASSELASVMEFGFNTVGYNTLMSRTTKPYRCHGLLKWNCWALTASYKVVATISGLRSSTDHRYFLSSTFDVCRSVFNAAVLLQAVVGNRGRPQAAHCVRCDVGRRRRKPARGVPAHSSVCDDVERCAVQRRQRHGFLRFRLLAIPERTVFLCVSRYHKRTQGGIMVFVPPKIAKLGLTLCRICC